MSDKVYSIDEIKELLMKIFEKYGVKKAILFGSYAKNKQNYKSDVDIVVDSDGKLLNIMFYALLEEITMALQKDVDLIEINEINQDSAIYTAIQKEGVSIYER